MNLSRGTAVTIQVYNGIQIVIVVGYGMWMSNDQPTPPENYANSLSSTTAMLEYSTLLRIIITILELALGKWRNMTNPKVEVNCL